MLNGYCLCVKWSELWEYVHEGCECWWNHVFEFMKNIWLWDVSLADQGWVVRYWSNQESLKDI